MIRFTFNFLFLLSFSAFSFSQTSKIETLNAFISQLNHEIDFINQEQQKLQQYHQDLYRYYRLFDTLQVQRYQRDSLYEVKIEVPDFVQKDYDAFSYHAEKLDSVIQSIDYTEDIVYDEENIKHFNERIEYISLLSKNLQEDIENFQAIFSEQSVASKKRSYPLMLEEIKKIEFQINQVKRKKISITEIEYEIPISIQKKLPRSYLRILQNYQYRIDTLSKGMNKEDIIHYFMPEKYFDKWITKSYSVHYWQVKYLQDVLVNPIIERGLKTYYNEEVKNFSLQSIKNINDYSSLPFEYVPISNSPLGASKKIFFILILDVSNSMNEMDKLASLKNSVNEFVDALRPNDKFAILLFSNTSQELVLPSERDKEYIKYRVNDIKAFGNTLPESAIFRAYNILNLQTNKDFKNQIILITDGVFEVTGKMKYHINQGKRKDIRFSIIQIDPEEESYKDMEKLSDLSNGKIYFISDKDTYQTMIDEILR